MTNQPDDTNTTHHVWLYDGTWTKIPNPIPMADGDNHFKKMSQAGFYQGETLGWNAQDVEIWEHRDGDRWVVEFTPIGHIVQTIHVEDLPSLIDLLSKLAPIATASVTSQVAEQLKSLILNVGEDGYHEREHRRRLGRP